METGRAISDVMGIIFDLDNTLLRSRIDFPRMKAEVFEYLAQEYAVPHDFPIHEHTTATLIETVRSGNGLTNEQERAVWQIVAQREEEGMKGAELERGATRVVERLQRQCRLVVFTNNAYAAARLALQSNGIDRCFEHVVGREQAGELKPSPSGVRYILRLYPQIPAERWLLVGDAWIDGKAAEASGVRFLAYRGDRREMERRMVRPVAYIDDLEALLDYVK